MAFWWYFTPDVADIAACKGVASPDLGSNRRYLEEIGFATSGEKLPENVFYRLAIKASGPAYILDI